MADQSVEKTLTEILSNKDVHLGGEGLQKVLLVARKFRDSGKGDLLVRFT